MKQLALTLCVVLLAACTGPQGTHQHPASKPAADPAPTTGVSVSGYARYGVVKRG